MEGGKKEQDLKDQRDDDDARAAEYDLQEASLSLFKKQDAVIFVFHKTLFPVCVWMPALPQWPAREA